MIKEKLKKEVEYRLAKMMVQIMFSNNLISKREMNRALKNLVYHYRPPFGAWERGIYLRENKKDRISS